MTVYTTDGERATVTRLERKALKNQLLLVPVTDKRTGRHTEMEDYFVFQAKCIKKFGPEAGVFLRQLIFWDGHGDDPEGWIYKARDEMEDETGLGRRQQDKARKILAECEVLVEKLRTVHPHHQYRTMHYRVNLVKLVEVLKTPGSTLNQWKRDRRYKKDKETGKYERLPDEVRHGNTEPDLQHDNSVPEVLHGNSVPEVRDDNSVPEVLHGNSVPDLRHGITVPTAENTPEDNVTDNTESTSEKSFREATHARADGQEGHRAPPELKNSNTQKGPEDDEGVNGETTASSPEQPDVESSLGSEVKRLLQLPPEGKNQSAFAFEALQRGKADLGFVCEAVSWELFKSIDRVDEIRPIVQRIIEDMETAA